MNPRDRERAHILTLLAAEWEKYPNLRFGQLVENLIGPSFVGCGSEAEHYAHCIYHVDDKDVTEKLMAGIPEPTPGPEPTALDQALSRRIMEALA